MATRTRTRKRGRRVSTVHTPKRSRRRKPLRAKTKRPARKIVWRSLTGIPAIDDAPVQREA